MSAISIYPVSVKGILCAPVGEVVLLLSEREGWKLPGGRTELGGSSAECLVREVAEELNLRVGVGVLVDTHLLEVVPNKHVSVVTYACALFSPFEPIVSYERRRPGLFAPDALPVNLSADYRASVVAACNMAIPPD